MSTLRLPGLRLAVIGVVAVSSCARLFPSDPGPAEPLGMSQDGRQFVLILPSCADGSIFGITVRSGATGKAATLWDVKSGPSLPADHRLVLGDATDFTVVTPWTVPKPGQAMEVDVVLGNYDQTYHGDFRTDAIGAAINGGIAHNHRDVTQKQLDADAHCS